MANYHGKHEMRMHFNLKRVLSFFMAMVLIVSLMNISVLAATDGEASTEPAAVQEVTTPDTSVPSDGEKDETPVTDGASSEEPSKDETPVTDGASSEEPSKDETPVTDGATSEEPTAPVTDPASSAASSEEVPAQPELTEEEKAAQQAAEEAKAAEEAAKKAEEQAAVEAQKAADEAAAAKAQFEADNEAIDEEKVLGDMTIHVSAPVGAFPTGTKVSIKEVKNTLGQNLKEFLRGLPALGSLIGEDDDDTTLKMIANAVASALDGDDSGTQAAYDITFTYEGEEVQPAVNQETDERYAVEVTFTPAEDSELAGGQAQLFHLTDGSDAQDNGLNAKELPTAENVVAVPVEASVNDSTNEVTVEATSFSIYVYNNKSVTSEDAKAMYKVMPSGSVKLTSYNAQTYYGSWKIYHYDASASDKLGSAITGTDLVAVSYNSNKSTATYQFKNAAAGSKYVVEWASQYGYIHEYFYIEVVDTVETISTAGKVTMTMKNYSDNTNWLGGGYNDTTGSITQNLLSKTTGSNGFPTKAGTNYSVKDWFTGGNAQTVDNLFLKNEYNADGYYYFNSADYFAELGSDHNFTVYNAQATPDNSDYFFYQRGNFLPYNSLSKASLSDNTNDYNYLGEKRDSSDPLKGQKMFLTNNTVFHFGMYMTANFQQPKNGQVNSKDMIFEFTGDDDMWIYIDGVLVLDLGGIHDAQSGSINFSTGDVTWTTTAKKGGAPTWHTTNLKDLFAAAGKSTDSGFTDNTFSNYSSHKIQMLYMERGAGASNLRIKFNLPVIPDGTVNVTKQVEGLNAAQAKDKTYSFTLSKNSKVLKGEAYDVYEGDTKVSSGTTDASTGYFTLSAGQTARFSDATAGATYTANEIDPQDHSTATWSSRSGTAQSDDSLVFTCTNDYSAYTGSLTVSKTVVNSGSFTSGIPSSFKFTITNSDGFSKELTVSANDSATVEGLLPGKYTVAETEAGKPEDSKLTTTYQVGQESTSSALVASGAASTVAVTNTYTATNGDETFTKTWVNAPADDRSIEVTLSDGTNSSDAFTIDEDHTSGSITLDDKSYTWTAANTDSDSWTITFAKLPILDNGSYTLSESKVNGLTYGNDGTVVTGVSDAEPNGAGKWTRTISGSAITNTYQDYSYESTNGDVTLTVNKTDAATGSAMSGVTFTVYNAQNESVGSGITGNDGKLEITLTAPAAGNYRLVETKAANYVKADDISFEITQSGKGVAYTETSDGSGKFTRTLTSAITGNSNNAFNVTNTHETGVISVTKVSNIDGDYTFGLYTKSGDDYTAVKDSKGKPVTVSVTSAKTEETATSVSFPAVNTTETYYVKELDGAINDYKLDTSYSPAANQDGYVVISNLTTSGAAVECTNTYTLNTVSVTGTKTWVTTGYDGDHSNSDVTITLYQKIGTMGSKTAVDSKDYTFAWGTGDKANTYTFSGLRKTQDGKDITYSVEETALKGLSKDSSGRFVVYKSGTSGEVLGYWQSEQSGNNFTNTWVPAGKDGTGTFTVHKIDTATGAGLMGVTFSLYEGTDTTATAYRSGSTTKTEGENAVYQDVVFSDLKAGEYTLVETPPNAGYTAAGPWKVSVSDTGDIKYVTTEDHSSSGGNVFTNIWDWVVGVVTGSSKNLLVDGKLTVENSYSIKTYNSTSLNLTATKTLTGRNMNANEFSFSVTEKSNTVATAKNLAAAAGVESPLTFGSIQYTAAGTYDYTVSEDIPETKLGGVTYDETKYAVEVVVAYNDKHDGTADLYVESVKVAKVGEAVENSVTASNGSYNVASFVNKYEAAPTSLAIHATKTLTGNKTLEANLFTFNMVETDAQGNELEGAKTATAKNAAAATGENSALVTFDEITYTELGTHYYKITEAAGDLRGVTYDKDSKLVTVTVTDNTKGQLIAKPSYDGTNYPTFNNSYAIPEGSKASVTFTGTKNLTGKAMTNDFRFDVYVDNSPEVTKSVYNVGSKISFTVDGLTKGSHTLKVEEANGGKTINGVTYDTSVYTVAVDVRDDGTGNGTLEAVVTSVKDANGVTVSTATSTGIVFNNSYKAADAKVSITGTKTLTGKALAAGDFTFDLYSATMGDDGTLTQGSKMIAEAKNDVATGSTTSGSFTFADQTISKAGTYWYVVNELNGGSTIAGVTYDASVYAVKVAVTDNGSGALAKTTTVYSFDSATGAVGEPVQGNQIAFANTYAAAAPSSASLNLTATKTLTGRNMDEGEFSFHVMEGTTEVATGTNTATGAVNFSAITYTKKSDAGLHTYFVSETSKNGNGVTVDGNTYTVNVEVAYKDKLDGTAALTVESVKVGENSVTASNGSYNVASFANTYAAKGTAVTLIGTKSYNKTLNGGEFSFNLVETTDADGSKEKQDGTTQSVSNVGSAISFSTINYNTVGTHYYKISEVNGGTTSNGITYDGSVKMVTVNVEDNGKGSLVAEVSVNGTGVTGSEGAYNFGSFTNTYAVKTDATASVTLTGTKNLTGRTMKPMGEKEFKFSVMENTTLVATGYSNASTTGTAAITFPEISYTTASIGTHTYMVTEDVPQSVTNGVTYDTGSYTVTVVVRDNGEGGLNAAITGVTNAAGTTVSTATSTGIVFNNSYAASAASVAIGGTKTLTGKNLADDMFSFQLYTATGAAVGEDGVTHLTVDLKAAPAATATNKADKSFTFASRTLTAAGDYWYVVNELNGGSTIAGITYDASVYAVKVAVTDNGSGALAKTTTVYSFDSATGAVGEPVQGNQIAFANSYESKVTETSGTSVTLTGTKHLTGATLTDNRFSFIVKEGETTVATGTNTAAGTITFSAINYSETGTHTYTVSELNNGIRYMTYDATEYTVTVAVTGSDNGSGVTTLKADVTYPADGIVFTNTYSEPSDDDDDDPTPTPTPGGIEIPDNPTPLAPTPTDPTQPNAGTTNIENPKTPLASKPDSNPKTGDSLALWIAAAGVSGIGLLWFALTGHKRRDDNNAQ